MWEAIRADSAFPAYRRLAEDNLNALAVCSRYLNRMPRYIQPSMLGQMRAECGLNEEEAYRWLMAAACGINGDERESDRRLERLYFPKGVQCLSESAYRSNAYSRLIRMPKVRRGNWEMDVRHIDPYEAIVCDDLLQLPDGREIPQIGYFRERFETPVVYQHGREWMTVTPSEQNTMRRDAAAVSGRVVVFGLGLGYFALLCSEKESVQSVTVVELDADVIALFTEWILPQFPHAKKITLVQADAFSYAETMPQDAFDFAYVDIWHDVLDGVNMYLRMKRLEHHSLGTKFLYWIEPSMLAWLRGMALMEAAEGIKGPMLQTIGEYRNAQELKVKITDAALRAVAARIPLEVTQR